MGTETLSSTVYITPVVPPTPPPQPPTVTVTPPPTVTIPPTTIVTQPPTPVVTAPPTTSVVTPSIPTTGGGGGITVTPGTTPGGVVTKPSTGVSTPSTVCEVNCDVPKKSSVIQNVQPVTTQPAQVVAAPSTPVAVSTPSGISGGPVSGSAAECVCAPATSTGTTKPSIGGINCADKTNQDIQACETGPVMLTTNVAGVETPVAPSYVTSAQLSYTAGSPCVC